VSAPETLGALVREAMGCACVADLEVLPACSDGEPHPCSLDRGHDGAHECGLCGQTWERGPWDDDEPARAFASEVRASRAYTGAVIEAWRREAGLSQAALARALGMDPRTLRSRLTGRMPFLVDDLAVLLDTLGRPTSHLPLLFPADWDCSL